MLACQIIRRRTYLSGLDFGGLVCIFLFFLYEYTVGDVVLYTDIDCKSCSLYTYYNTMGSTTRLHHRRWTTNGWGTGELQDADII